MWFYHSVRDLDEATASDRGDVDGSDTSSLPSWRWTLGVALVLALVVAFSLWPIHCRNGYVVIEPTADSSAVRTSSTNVGCDSVIFTPLSYERNGSLDDLRLRLAAIAVGGGVIAFVAGAALIRGGSRWFAPETIGDEPSSEDEQIEE